MNNRTLVFASGAAAFALVLAGCAPSVDASTSTTDNSSTASPTGDAYKTAAEVLAENQQAHDEDGADAASDAQYEETDAVTIALGGSSATSSDSESVTIDGTTVTISGAGTFVLSGELEGQIVVNSEVDGQVKLVLDGVDISNSAGAALDIMAADEAVVILAAGASNALSDGAGVSADRASAALNSAADLTITGTGSLDVTGAANDGIASSDGLIIQSGTITVHAVDDGIRGKDYLIVRGGSIDVVAGGDGLKSDNEEDATRGYIALLGGDTTITSDDEGLDAFTDVVVTEVAGTAESSDTTLKITAGGGNAVGGEDASAKGISAGVIGVFEGGAIAIDAADDAINVDAYVHLAGATVELASGDDGVHADLQLVVSAGDLTITESVEGLESGEIVIAGGATDVTASDDGLNVSEPDSGTAAQALLISGGILLVDAGGDGLDVNSGSLTQTGGTVVVSGPTDNGNGALDADGGVTISGGTLVALGSSGMAMAPAASSAQATVQFALSQAAVAGTTLTLTDASGNAIASITVTKATQNVVYSAPEIVNGDSYTLLSGGSAGTSIVGPLAEGGSGGTTLVTAVAGQQSEGGMGGGPGGMGGAPGGDQGGAPGGGQRP